MHCQTKKVRDNFIHQGNNLDCSVSPCVGLFIKLKEGKYKIAYPYDSQIVSCFALAVKEYCLLYQEYKYCRYFRIDKLKYIEVD